MQPRNKSFGFKSRRSATKSPSPPEGARVPATNRNDLIELFRKSLKGLENFIEHAYKRPTWILATIIACSCLTFIVSHQVSAPSEENRLEDLVNRRQVEIEDTERILRLYDDSVNLAQPVEDVSGGFLKIIDQVHNTGQLTGYEQQIDVLLNSEIKIRQQLESVLANLRGTKLQTPYLEENLRATEHFLAAVGAYLNWLEESYKPYLQEDSVTFFKELIQKGPKLKELNLQVQTSVAAIESAASLHDATVKAERLELTRAKDDVRRYHTKGMLQIPAALFFIAYAVIGIVNVRGFVNREYARPAKPRRRRKKRK